MPQPTGPLTVQGRLRVEGDTTLEGNLTLTGPPPTLPNGTTATTQLQGDSSTKLATTAFVQEAGIVGPQGPAGPTGATGPSGPQGPGGYQGQMGPAGATGATGPAIYLEPEPPEEPALIPGPQGIQGIAGTTGAQGPTGPPIYLEAEQPEDPVYLPGPPGIQGVQGLTGAVGPPVYLEAPEADEPIPLPGPPGIQGVQGIQGQTGVPVYLEAEQPEDIPMIAPIVGPTGPQGATGSTGAAGSAGPSGWINLFYNGPMDVAQGGTSGSVSSGSTAYTLDGWQIMATGAAAAWAQEYNANIAGNALRISAASGLTACTLQQRMESYVAAHLLTNAKAAQAITVQWTIYNNSGASITPKIATGYASAQDNFATVDSDLAATSLQTIANGALGVVAYTFTPSANLYLGYQVQLQLGGALNGSSGYIDISQADIRITAGLSTGLNNSPPTPVLRPIQTELAWSQRYFYTSYPNGTAPGTANHTDLKAVQGYLSGTWSFEYTIYFPVQMHAAPSISYWDGAGNASKLSYTGSGGTSFTDNGTNQGSAAFEIGQSSFLFTSTVASTSGNYFIHYTANARL